MTFNLQVQSGVGHIIINLGYRIAGEGERQFGMSAAGTITITASAERMIKKAKYFCLL